MMSKVMKCVFLIVFLMISVILLITQGPGHKFQTPENVKKPNISLQFDSEAKSFQPWKNDTNCQQFLTQFAKKGSLPARALVSFPGSGNTWIR